MIGSRLILGTVQFGLDYGINNLSGKPAKIEVFKMLDLAFQNGIHILDTAIAYGNAIELIGAYHRQSVNQFKVISKSKNTSLESIEKDINTSLEILNIEAFEGYMLHSMDDYFKEGLVDKLFEIKLLGKVKKIGVSIYHLEELQLLMDDTRIDIIQLPFNVLDNHNIKGDLLQQAKLKGKEIHTRSVFLQGLFFKTIENLDPKFENLKIALIQLKNIALKADISIESLALNYCLHKSYIDQVLIGVDNFSQLNMNLSLINADLTIENEIDSNIFVDNVAMLNPVNWS
ncbi:MAG: hypothetical protein RL308_3097 [Bacteroidota bacterium]|jgi:aryl-alcohol dehydrogenase-like predicted oxidoreductase